MKCETITRRFPGGHPRRNIISVRVTDDELLFLKRLLDRREATISDLIREALGRAAEKGL